MNRELDAEIAVKLFGWEWLETVSYLGSVEEVVRKKPLKAIFPPKSDREKTTFVEEHFQPALPETERFEDWDSLAVNKAVEGHWRSYMGLPRYSRDWSAAQEVVEAMLDKGFRWNASSAVVDGKKLYMVAFATKPYVDDEQMFLSDSLPTAICQAALRAL